MYGNFISHGVRGTSQNIDRLLGSMSHFKRKMMPGQMIPDVYARSTAQSTQSHFNNTTNCQV